MKSRAQADQWEEEVVLLCEEMCQCIMYCRWKASWWIEQQFARVQQLPEEDIIHEGLEAYAKQQASYELQLAGVWETRWLPVQQ